MSDLTGKTITIPADLGGLAPTPSRLRNLADLSERHDLSDFGQESVARVLAYLVRRIEEHHPPRTAEPDEFGAMVEAGTQVPGEEPRERRRMLRCKAAGAYRWTDDRGRVYRWSELIDPRPVD